MTDYIYPELEPICNNLRKYRKQKNLTQKHLAVLVGCQRTYISALERGKINPTLLTLIQLSKELGVDARDLLTGVPDEADSCS